MKRDLTGILMCGGKSSRMGQDKYALLFNGKPLYSASLQMLESLCTSIIVSSNKTYPEFSNYTVLRDEVMDIGPIGGLYTCLKNSKATYNMVIACDMPLVDGTTMCMLLEHLEGRHDVIVPQYKGQLQPLYAIYMSSIIPIIEQCIASKRYSLQLLLSMSDVCVVNVAESCTEFKNVNLQEDLC
jgi:molybdopterin-guanine dinucleotide biosynthesis protein A